MKKSTGIPCSFMLQVDDPNVKGAMMTTCGHYAIPAIDAQAYAATKKAGSLGAKKEPKPEHREDPVPVELQCLICHDLLVDAAIIPCCGNSYCDDCIRTTLLESEGHICPTCNQSDVSPDTLIANKFLRQAVGHFKDKKNITRTAIRKSDSALPLAAVPAPSLGLPTPPPLNSQHQKTLNQPNAGSHCPQALFLSEAHTAFRLPSHQLACVSNSCIQAGAFSKVNQHPPYHHVPGFSGPYYQFPLPSGQQPLHTHPPGSLVTHIPSLHSPFSPPRSTGGSSESQQLSPHFPSSPSLSPYPYARPTALPNWTHPNPHDAPIPPLFTSYSIPPLIQKEWFHHHRQSRERASHSQSVYKRSFPCQSKTCHSPSQCRRSSCRFRYRSRSPSSCPTVPYTSHSSICNHKPSHSPAQLLSSHHQQVHSHRKSKAGHAKKHLDLTAKNRKRERKRTHKTRQKTYAGEQSR
ncbi:uncharacterized protein LOC129171595 isoform X3 [Dunckerocampus dactyliophorus]|nr:uncharacterized protein LOC129171595 isoform X3 [Dunckerocampus dactyliophorus]